MVTEGNFTRASLQADGREADAAVGDGRSESDDSDGDPAHKFAAKLRARLISGKSSGSPRVDGQMQDKQGLQGLRQDWKNGGGALANADPGVGSGGKAGGDGEEIVEETEEEVDETDAEQEGQGGHPRLRDLPFKSGQQSACAVVKTKSVHGDVLARLHQGVDPNETRAGGVSTGNLAKCLAIPPHLELVPEGREEAPCRGYDPR